MDTQKIVKLMNLTLSENDHEALSALRKANAILRQNKVLWDSVVRTDLARESKSEPKAEEEFLDVLERMIQALLASPRLKGKSRQFIESLGEYYNKNGYLSDRQETILRQIFERTIEVY